MPLDMTHLFWDFDGTLYNSYEQIVRSMLYALGDLGIFAPPSHVYGLTKKTVYHAQTVLAQEYSLPLQALQQAFHKYHDAIESFPLYEGVDSCLYTLKRYGCKHYLYTHRGRQAVHQLEQDDLSSCFTGFITREDGFPDKPSPQALEAMMAKYDVPKKEAIMIGDRDIDILAGHNAGLRCILFDPDGFYPDVAVEHRVKSMREIVLLVQEMKR